MNAQEYFFKAVQTSHWCSPRGKINPGKGEVSSTYRGFNVFWDLDRFRGCTLQSCDSRPLVQIPALAWRMKNTRVIPYVHCPFLSALYQLTRQKIYWETPMCETMFVSRERHSVWHMVQHIHNLETPRKMWLLLKQLGI